jgi:hypothetical protein
MEKQVKRDDKGKFLPGSKALGGRPKGRMLSTLIRENTDDLRDIVQPLIDAYTDNSTKMSDRIKIAELLLAYAVGKPVQAIEMESNNHLVIGPKGQIDADRPE